MTLSNRWNRTVYRLYAPMYDQVARPLEHCRRRAIDQLDLDPRDRVLIPGCGTGMDLEYLPADVSVTCVDITLAMVRRTATRGDALGVAVDAQVGDAGRLPFDADAFDAVFLHLLLSVVPDPDPVVAETARVLAPDGAVSILDKFVPEGTQPSLLRRVLNPVARRAFSDLTRSLEPMVDGTDLVVGSCDPCFGGVYTVTTARHRDQER